MENTRKEGLDEQDQIIDVESFTKDGIKPPVGKKYKIKVNQNYYTFDHQIVTGREILETACIIPVECFWLFQKFKGCDFEKIDLTEKVDLAKPGIEEFVAKPTEVFHYFVDNEPETTDQKELTPNQILTDAGITPVSDYYLVRINADGSQNSYANTPNTPIKMVCPAVKFVSVFKGETPVS